jgi:hypothetical protein
MDVEIGGPKVQTRWWMGKTFLAICGETVAASSPPSVPRLQDSGECILMLHNTVACEESTEA